jgi:branched-subunit amino acid transport protein
VSEAWTAVLVIGVVTIAMKAVGPLAAHGRELPAPLARVVDLLAPAVLAALVATQTLGGDRELVLDERAAGIAAAAVAIALRAPILVAVVAAAVVTALLRLVT